MNNNEYDSDLEQFQFHQSFKDCDYLHSNFRDDNEVDLITQENQERVALKSIELPESHEEMIINDEINPFYPTANGENHSMNEQETPLKATLESPLQQNNFLNFSTNDSSYQLTKDQNMKLTRQTCEPNNEQTKMNLTEENITDKNVENMHATESSIRQEPDYASNMQRNFKSFEPKSNELPTNLKITKQTIRRQIRKRRVPPTTKNIIKDVTNQVITLGLKKRDWNHEGWKKKRNTIITIEDFQNFLYNDPYSDKFRALTLEFIRFNYIRWVYSSQTHQKRYLLMMRSILERKCLLKSGDELRSLID